MEVPTVWLACSTELLHCKGTFLKHMQSQQMTQSDAMYACMHAAIRSSKTGFVLLKDHPGHD